jgi:glucosamine-6-phosphate deaminase
MQNKNHIEIDFFVEKLHVFKYITRVEMGNKAALMAEKKIISMLQNKATLNIIFAAAPSQNEFLEALTNCGGIDWSRINAFHMDEYIGLPENASQRFSTFLKDRIFGKVQFHAVSIINGENSSPEEECERYSNLLEAFPPDIVFMGIGENGHIAFNDPPIADFMDPECVKVVELDLACRQQQVNDGCFGNLAQVPIKAITLTIPTLLKAEQIFCMVPGPTKAKAVYDTLNRSIHENYPSTILRKHESAKLFLDNDSAKLL